MATVTRTLQIIVNQGGNAVSGLSRIVGGLGKVAAISGGIALAGITAIGVGLVGAGVAGLSMNDAMEQASARIQAFTKDGAKTAEILEMVRDRAARTPFAFQEMSAAAAGLLPSARQAGVGLEYLIQQAEILAASNPAEGLEGAAFALKEAVSGDFTSIIERFNLPRQFINQLKEEGVPNLEIVQRAMQELGLDTDLVSALANTAQGRWSTFKDTLQNLAATVTKPLFDTMSNSLGGLNATLDANAPRLQALAETMAQKVQVALDFIFDTIQKMIPIWNEWSSNLSGTTGPALVLIEDAIKRIAEAFGINTEEISTQDVILRAFKGTLDLITTAIKAAALVFQGVAWAVESVSRAIRIAQGLASQLGTIFSVMASNASNAVNRLINTWNNMVNAARRAANAIPSWLRPGSPTPFEIGLRGIASAAGSVSKALPNAFSAGGGGGLPGAGAGAGATGGGITINLTYAPMVSTADRIEVEQRLGPLLIDVLRQRGVKVG